MAHPATCLFVSLVLNKNLHVPARLVVSIRSADISNNLLVLLVLQSPGQQTSA